jgi:predicted metalloprotease with PDZ domain
MVSRSFRLLNVALLIATGALLADEARKCTVPARECEQAIRKMLAGRRYLGAQVEELNPGLAIKAIAPESPAERAELKVGDRLMIANGRSLAEASIREFKQIVSEARGTGRLWVIVQRHGILQRVEVRLEPYSKAQIDKIVAQHLAQFHPSEAAAPQPQQ